MSAAASTPTKCAHITSANLCAICGTTECKMHPVRLPPGERAFVMGAKSFYDGHLTDGSVYAYNTYLCGKCTDSLAERPLQQSVVDGLKALCTPECKEWIKQQVVSTVEKLNADKSAYAAWVSEEQSKKRRATQKTVVSKKK